ncbi:MAG: aspartate aminotransferase family protein [Desulfurococcales archaeon]|nr:aspartate aminotransferase family protein [Desulfurococcales archaeon]
MDKFIDMRGRYVSPGVYLIHPITVTHGVNELLYDVEGREYLDFTSGIGVTNLGHSNRELVQAALDQLGKLWHISIHVANYPAYVTLASMLVERVKLSGPAMTAFFNSGAEATENAVKVSRRASGRPYVVSFIGGFHGRTTLALSLTGKYKPYKVGFEPLAPSIVKAPYPYCYRLRLEEDDCLNMVMSSLELLVDVDLDPSVVASIMVEPIQGEGGFVVPPKGFLRELESFARRRDILLIVDEIQTGYCRTGKFMAYEHYGISPDIVTLGKAMANGLPISGIVGVESVMKKMDSGSIGGTFGGNPVSAAVAVKVIEVIERDNLCMRAESLGKLLSDRLSDLEKKYDFIGDVRGLGVMKAVELVKDKHTREPDKGKAKRIVEEARRRGLLLLTAGYYGNVVRLHPPLTISEENLARGLDILAESVKSIA